MCLLCHYIMELPESKAKLTNIFTVNHTKEEIMSVQEAIQTLEEERFKFSLHLKKKRLKPRMLAPVIGKSESYVRQLLSGAATGDAAKEHLDKLFKFTDYNGEGWL